MKKMLINLVVSKIISNFATGISKIPPMVLFKVLYKDYMQRCRNW